MTPLAPVAADAAMKLVSGKVVHHLGEDGAAGVHAPLWAPHRAGRNGADGNSNRKQRGWALTPRPSMSWVHSPSR